MKPIPWKRGMKITEPGIYSGVPMSVYHSQDLCDGPSISSSGLRKIFNESPAHFYATWDGNPDREDLDESAAFTIGRAAHHLLLGEDAFSTLFIGRPDVIDGAPWQGNRNACKAWLKAQAVAGRTVLKPEDIKAIRGMARSLAVNPMVKAGILNGAVEQSMVWRCKDTGLWKKARPDCIPNSSGDFADLKTCVSVQTDDLQRSIFDNGYAQQGALICEGWHAITGNAASSFSLVFVEKTPPYCCRVLTLRDEDLIRAERANYAAMETFAKCLASSEWPGPGSADAEYLYMPEWAAKKIDYRIEQMEAEAA